MASYKPGDTERPSLDVVVAGDGISPCDVSVRELAAMLQAAATLLDAVAGDAGHLAPRVTLSEITTGSAAYRIEAADEADDEAYEAVVAATCAAARKRGQGAPSAVRHALQRLFGSTSRGAIELRPKLLHHPELAPVLLAAPLQQVPEELIGTTVLHGRLVGVEVLRSRYVLRLKLEGAGKVELDAEDRLAEQAGRLFNRKVRARVRATWKDEAKRGEYVALAIEHWHDDDLLDVFGEIRSELREAGIRVDADRFLETSRDR